MSEYIVINGWSQKDGLKLIQKVESRNNGSKAKIFCAEELLIQVFDSYPHFGVHDVVVDEVIVKKNSIDRQGNRTEKFGQSLVIMSEDGDTIGVVWI